MMTAAGAAARSFGAGGSAAAACREAGTSGSKVFTPRISGFRLWADGSVFALVLALRTEGGRMA